MQDQNLLDIFGPVISRYTRAQAIEDGLFVDPGEMAKEAGFKFPVALTRAVWEKYVTVPPGVIGQDETGRLWDVLQMLRYGIRISQPGQEIIWFRLHVRNDNRAGDPPLVTLRAQCGPGDEGEPVITIMLRDED